MSNLTEQAKRVLEVYLERGESALRSLRSGNVEQALKHLLDRKAAFHNFRVVEARAAEEGEVLIGHPLFAGLLSQLQLVDIHLMEEMEKARGTAADQARKLSAARRKIGKYRSTEEILSRFEQSV